MHKHGLFFIPKFSMEGEFMIDKNLHNRMEQALLDGQYDEALELSQQLDIQILDEMKKIMETKQGNYQ